VSFYIQLSVKNIGSPFIFLLTIYQIASCVIAASEPQSRETLHHWIAGQARNDTISDAVRAPRDAVRVLRDAGLNYIVPCTNSPSKSTAS
jgi:hypothetical protein